MAEQRYRVTNTCKFDIGITLPSQQNIVIKAGSFQLLTADDIMYAESICRKTKYFSKRMLIPYDAQNKQVPFEQLGGFMEVDANPHLSDEEIKTAFKQSVKKVESWLQEVQDPSELFAIAEVAKTMDLPASKLKLIMDKVPNLDLLQ